MEMCFNNLLQDCCDKTKIGCNDVSAMIMYMTHSNDHLNFDNDVATTNEYSAVLQKSNSRLSQILTRKKLRSSRQFLTGDAHEFL